MNDFDTIKTEIDNIQKRIYEINNISFLKRIKYKKEKEKLETRYNELTNTLIENSKIDANFLATAIAEELTNDTTLYFINDYLIEKDLTGFMVIAPFDVIDHLRSNMYIPYNNEHPYYIEDVVKEISNYYRLTNENNLIKFDYSDYIILPFTSNKQKFPQGVTQILDSNFEIKEEFFRNNLKLKIVLKKFINDQINGRSLYHYEYINYYARRVQNVIFKVDEPKNYRDALDQDLNFQGDLSR